MVLMDIVNDLRSLGGNKMLTKTLTLTQNFQVSSWTEIVLLKENNIESIYLFELSVSDKPQSYRKKTSLSW